ncbi:sugar transferase, partial [Pelagibacteraceae bacterium]|nr:sugar transferase [Pelagibacteraceae bacterium]
LMNNNVIQRNIMLVGTLENIEKILEEKKDKINIYKCCLIKDDNIGSLKKARMSLKIPVFTHESEMRIILEYHELGQIWILDNEEKNLVNYFLDLVIKFSVDIIIVNLKDRSKNSSNLFTDNLINSKYSYSNYQTSQFYGLSLLLKLFLDKILAILFLLFLSPIFLIAILLIYLEDGFPIFFSEESTGWDGRRFNAYKLRIHKNNNIDKNAKNEEHLKVGNLLKKLHIDEIPQLFNVFRGDMSIVGPRPHDFKSDLAYAKVFNKFLKRNKAAPGLTGWAQIHGFRGSNPSNAHMIKRMEYDLWYMNNWSIWLDFYIIFKTFLILFSKPK